MQCSLVQVLRQPVRSTPTTMRKLLHSPLPRLHRLARMALLHQARTVLPHPTPTRQSSQVVVPIRQEATVGQSILHPTSTAPSAYRRRSPFKRHLLRPSTPSSPYRKSVSRRRVRAHMLYRRRALLTSTSPHMQPVHQSEVPLRRLHTPHRARHHRPHTEPQLRHLSTPARQTRRQLVASLSEASSLWLSGCWSRER